MPEQQLVDYIKQAKAAGQTDEQTRSLLYKNGWTASEVGDAFASSGPVQTAAQPQPQAQTQPQAVSQPKVEVQPQAVSQPNPQPQPQSQPQAQQPAQNNMPQMRAKSHLVFKLLIALIIVVVLCGVGLFVAGQYISFPWNPFSPSPAAVISKMMTNMGKVKVDHTVSQIEIIASNNSSKASQGDLALNTDSEMDKTNINNLKADGTFTIKLTLPGASSVLSADISMAAVGNALYLKVNSVTVPSDYSYPGLDVSKIIGAGWLKVDQDSIKVLSQAEAGQIAVPDISQINNSEPTQQIQNLISTENMLSVSKQLGDQVIGGQNTYHYLAIISKEKLEDLADKIITLETQEAANSQTQGAPAGSSSSLVGNMAQAFVKTFGDAIGDTNIEIWIGKNDYMLYQAKLDKVIDLSKVFPGVNMQLEIKFNVTNSNFGKAITVQAPAAAQKIEDIVLPLLKTQKIKSDMGQIGFPAEELYNANQSYSLLCSRGLLNGYLKDYGADLVLLNNDIVSQGGTKPACFSSVQDYCVSTQLADGTYLCIDNKNAIVGTTKCVSAQTVCK